MKLPEWTAYMIGALQEAGFEVSEYHGFPLVQRPKAFADSMRLLKWSPPVDAKGLTFAIEKRIYAEGMLIVPFGSPTRDTMEK